MGRTTKPCPGCGKVSSARSAKQVCFECERLMADGKAYRGRLALELANQQIEVAVLPWQFYSLPYLGYCEEVEPFQKAFLSIAKLVSSPATVENSYSDSPLVPKTKDLGRFPDGAVRMFQPEVLKSLRQLYASIQKIIDAAEAKGHAEGRSIITGLATGEVSVDEFNEATTAKPRKR